MEEFEFENGIRVTVEPDLDAYAVPPIEGAGTWSQGVGIVKHGRGYIPADPESVLEQYERLRDRMEEGADLLGWIVSRLAEDHGAAWWESVESDDDHLIEASSILDELLCIEAELAGYVVLEFESAYTVVGDRELMAQIGGFDPSDTKACVWRMRAIAGEYELWSEGDVYKLTVEYPNGQMESVANVYPTGGYSWISESQAYECAMDYAPAGWNIPPRAMECESVCVGDVVSALGAEGLDPWAINRIMGRIG